MVDLRAIIDSLPSLKTTVEAHRLMAEKALGQNFLLNQDITDKIIRLSLSNQGLKSFEGASVFEVGPGPGGLTRAVLKAEPKKLTVQHYGGTKIQNRQYNANQKRRCFAI